MSRFLSVISVSEAVTIVSSIAERLSAERIPLEESLGRITGEDICSDTDIPGFDRSTVDGYALRGAETTGASDSIPSIFHLTGRVQMGARPDSLIPGTCMYIPTGGHLPKGADAVAMIEYCEDLGEEVLVHRPVAEGENVIRTGEDFSRDRIAVPRGTKITSRVMGVLSATGAAMVPVVYRPRIGILSTGDELVPVEKIPKEGEIRDVNTYLAAGFVHEMGGIAQISGIIPDERRSLEAALDTALDTCDAVFISGGSSKGERDMCVDCIASRGEVLAHGIAISPGKPTIIGKCREIPVIGLPGHPASAYIILQVIGRPLICRMLGVEGSERIIRLRLGRPISSAKGREDYVRGLLDGDSLIPLPGRSGLTNTLLASDGLIRIPAVCEGYEAGDLVDFILWSS